MSAHFVFTWIKGDWFSLIDKINKINPDHNGLDNMFLIPLHCHNFSSHDYQFLFFIPRIYSTVEIDSNTPTVSSTVLPVGAIPCGCPVSMVALLAWLPKFWIIFNRFPKWREIAGHHKISVPYSSISVKKTKNLGKAYELRASPPALV